MSTARVLLLDCETSSLDVATGHLLEVACVVWSVPHASTVRAYSALVRGPSNEAAKINRIPESLASSDDARPRDAVVSAIVTMSKGCDAIVAHGDFDRQWLPELQDRIWIDSCADIEWAQTNGSRALTSLLVAHDIPIGRAHRAMSDCDMIARLLEWHAAHGHDIQAMLARAMRPKAIFEVAERGFSAERNALAKANGFRFDDKDPTNKRWIRTMAIADSAELPFAVNQVSS